MTTMNSNERDERVGQIRERLAAHRTEAAKYRNREWAKGDALHYYEAPDDVETLLSLLDSQADDDARLDAMLKKAGIQHTCHRPHDAGTTLERLARNVSDTAATRMRDKCVAKVRAMREDWKIEADARRDPDNPHDYKGSYGLASGAVDACDDIITALESLTLDQVEQKQ